MQGVEHTNENNLSLLELVLQLTGDFRQRLEPIHVTPLQAGLLLFLCRHADASVTEAAVVRCDRLNIEWGHKGPRKEAVGYQAIFG